MNKDTKVIIKRINDWLECYQNKDDGYYNATELLRQYNEHYPNEQKLMRDFFRLNQTEVMIEKINRESPMEKSLYGNNQQVTAFYFKKGRNTRYGRTPDTYYFHEVLFLKFGAWLNRDLEYDIYKVISNLVRDYRNDVTKLMPEFKEAIKDFETDGNVFVKVHAMLNKAIFGKYIKEGQQLNQATENELFRYKQLQSEIMTLIKYNIIKDYLFSIIFLIKRNLYFKAITNIEWVCLIFNVNTIS